MVTERIWENVQVLLGNARVLSENVWVFSENVWAMSEMFESFLKMPSHSWNMNGFYKPVTLRIVYY